MKKHIFRFIPRLIFDSYSREESCITWDGIKSEYVSASNGVKEEGVISPILFSKPGYGCHIRSDYSGVLSYADDITISVQVLVV